jgi:hypothetical protein
LIFQKLKLAVLPHLFVAINSTPGVQQNLNPNKTCVGRGALFHTPVRTFYKNVASAPGVQQNQNPNKTCVGRGALFPTFVCKFAANLQKRPRI